MITLWLQSPELFSKVDRRVRLPVPSPGLPLCFWGSFFDPYRGNREFTSCRFFSFFYLCDSYSKKWSFAYPFITSKQYSLEIIVTFFAIFDWLHDSPSDWMSLRQSGTWRCSEPTEKWHLRFFHFFLSGGDFSHVPGNIENSPRGKWALGSKMGLKR